MKCTKTVCCQEQDQHKISHWSVYWPKEALLEERQAASFSDQDIRNLADLNTDEEDSVAGVLLVETLAEGL